METRYHGEVKRSQLGPLCVIKRDGAVVTFDIEKIRAGIKRAARSYAEEIAIDELICEVKKNIYDKVTTQELEKALILVAVSFIERDPAYGILAAQLLLQKMYKEVFGQSYTEVTLYDKYQQAFEYSIRKGVEEKIFHEDMLSFDFELLKQHLKIEHDSLLNYFGLQVLYNRNFLKINDKCVELPQIYWMRIAMGLALQEKDKNKWAIEFYEIISTLRYMPSTPTLFNAGKIIAQLSSCYLSTALDDLKHIFKVLGDNAQLSKWAGGIGNDWTNIRGAGSLIKTIRTTSQGVIPFLKLASDIVIGVAKSGIKRGGTCAYLEIWHYDIEDFLDLRRNTGDERRRTHDMNTANWIPDLFMKRVLADENWTLFSSDEVPDLHDIYGKEFEQRYAFYEQKAQEGGIKLFRVISAKKLWRKMLSRLFETGHPWITFKDPCNVRSPQDHAGVVHSSNLCTEITLNTSQEETAVCNLGSINLARHIKDGSLDEELLSKTIRSAIRMLDNVIDLNFYPTVEAQTSNFRHRPIGLGQMGFQDALFMLDIPFDSQEAITFADVSGELISYYAILASSELAKERGTYQSYKGSKWDRDIFPLDTLDILEKERGMKVTISRESRMDWRPIRAHVKECGMRNSNVLSIAPTATISNVVGCYPCIEPMYRNLYVKSNIAGEFTILNSYLVKDLKKIGLWNKEMLELIKYYDGEIQQITQIPQILRDKYKGVFEIDPIHLVKITAARGKWIDQSQSHNVFMKGTSGKQLHDIFFTGWQLGMKTFYYLRTLGATQIEKSTLDTKYGLTQLRNYDNISAENGKGELAYIEASSMCNPYDLSCESCQ